jgi:DinB superfamily
MTTNQTIIYGLTTSKGMLDALTADLKAGEWDHRATPGSNCTAWLVGHLIMADRRALALAGVTDLPPLPEGFETKFGREANAPQAATYGDASALMPMFDQLRDKLCAVISELPASKFDEPLAKPNARFKTVSEFFVFMGLHVIMHCGQISTIRRSLGRPPLF